jgi:hypothetical protein
LRQRHGPEEKIHKYDAAFRREQILAQRLGALAGLRKKMLNVAPSLAIDNGLGEVSENVFIPAVILFRSAFFASPICFPTASRFHPKRATVM